MSYEQIKHLLYRACKYIDDGEYQDADATVRLAHNEGCTAHDASEILGEDRKTTMREWLRKQKETTDEAAP